MFKRLSLLIAVSMISTSAFAAEGDWSGWHIGMTAGHASGSSDAGISLGGAWSSESQALRDHVVNNWSTDDLDPSGTAFGVTFGYDHQFDSNLILGAELDYSKLNADDSRASGPRPFPSAPSLSYNFGNSVEVDDQLSLRGKLGFAIDRHQLYATAGWTQVDAEFSAEVLSTGNYSKLGVQDDKLDGIQWGVGYAFDFGNQWSLRAEYLRTDLGDEDYVTAYRPGSAFVTPAYTETVDQDLEYDTFRLGIDYRF
jgi:outer membrane immunogenic protein